MSFHSTLRRAAVVCAVVAGVAVSSWHIDAATTGVAVAPDKSDSTTEEIKQVHVEGLGADPSRDHVEPAAGRLAVANDLGPDNTQVKH
jgi:hypothetical protein